MSNTFDPKLIAEALERLKAGEIYTQDALDIITLVILSEARRIGLEAIGEDGKVHGYIRPQSHPSIDLTESYQNDLRKEQRQRLLELTGGKE